jgi:hypothetical protein
MCKKKYIVTENVNLLTNSVRYLAYADSSEKPHREWLPGLCNKYDVMKNNRLLKSNWHVHCFIPVQRMRLKRRDKVPPENQR